MSEPIRQYCVHGGEGEVVKPIPPNIAGYLTKLKRKQSVFGSWAERYFQVNIENERIEYFKLMAQAVDSSYSTGFVDLWDITAVRNFEGTAFQIESGKRVLMLKAKSHAERTCWVDGLSEYIEKRQEYERFMESEKGRGYEHTPRTVVNRGDGPSRRSPSSERDDDGRDYVGQKAKSSLPQGQEKTSRRDRREYSSDDDDDYPTRGSRTVSRSNSRASRNGSRDRAGEEDLDEDVDYRRARPPRRPPRDDYGDVEDDRAYGRRRESDERRLREHQPPRERRDDDYDDDYPTRGSRTVSRSNSRASRNGSRDRAREEDLDEDVDYRRDRPPRRPPRDDYGYEGRSRNSGDQDEWARGDKPRTYSAGNDYDDDFYDDRSSGRGEGSGRRYR